MLNVVGTKGQVVIAKEARERLGIQPGWLTIQRVVGDHLEMYFVPPEHDESLAGALAPFLKRGATPVDDLQAIRDAAWAQTAGRKKVRRRRS